MSSDSLENEDLDNVPLVRMEDVQPSRERLVESRSSTKEDEEVYETCIIDDIEYENECVVNNDDDSNIGSMVSLQSEEAYEQDSSSQELIIPEVLEEVETENEEDELEIYVCGEEQNLTEEYLEDPIDDRLELDGEVLEGHKEFVEVPVDVEEQLDNQVQLKENKLVPDPLKQPLGTQIEIEVPPNKIKRVEQAVVTSPSESWPTLEILPGGVIKNTDKYESDSYLYPDQIQETAANRGEMMYACAKCSQTFKYLFCLVKHVKWHEDQKKIMSDPKAVLKMKSQSEEYICLHSGKKKIVAAAARNKRKTPKRLKS